MIIKKTDKATKSEKNGSSSASKSNMTIAIVAVIAIIAGFSLYKNYTADSGPSKGQQPATAVTFDKEMNLTMSVYLPAPLIKTAGDPLLTDPATVTGAAAQLSSGKLKFEIIVEDAAKLLESKFDFALLTPFDTLTLVNKVPSTKVLLETAQCDFQVKYFVRKDSSITKLEELKDKVVGTPVSTYPDLYLTLKPLEEAKVAPAKVLAFPGIRKGFIALLSGGEIEAYSVASRVAKDNPYMILEVPDGANLKEIYQSQFHLPCRYLVASETVPAPVIDHVLNVVSTERMKDKSRILLQRSLGITSNIPTTPEGLEKLKKELSWEKTLKVEIRE